MRRGARVSTLAARRQAAAAQPAQPSESATGTSSGAAATAASVHPVAQVNQRLTTPNAAQTEATVSSTLDRWYLPATPPSIRATLGLLDSPDVAVAPGLDAQYVTVRQEASPLSAVLGVGTPQDFSDVFDLDEVGFRLLTDACAIICNSCASQHLMSQTMQCILGNCLLVYAPSRITILFSKHINYHNDHNAQRQSRLSCSCNCTTNRLVLSGLDQRALILNVFATQRSALYDCSSTPPQQCVPYSGEWANSWRCSYLRRLQRHHARPDTGLC